MARNLRKFNTYSDYETAELVRPAVSLVVSPRKVYFDPINPTPPTPTFDGKWKATYSNGNVTSAECDSSSAITKNEISLTNLVSVEIGDCVTSIGSIAFYNCSSLTSVTIGSGVTTIGENAFMDCTSLISIDIPDSVTTIGENAFYKCSSLTNINIPSGVTTISTGVFQLCSSLTSIEIPNSVTSIGDSAFYDCFGLTSIDIPSGVTRIFDAAFGYCSSLTSITINATTPPIGIGDTTFRTANNCPIYVPSGSVDAYKSASGWSKYASRIQAIPNS